ncbi:putative DUF945 domain protein [Campylobacter iguaniorum]|uniref:DUF945 family protein n=1 Tax=Campylobacter iguaniorum TaxID=1244531 RepID=UPI0007C97F3D|nr:DUF945 family protein [Campylobacter iguaniorum]ANE35594.1 putative DUF945 domain protein [Campylobacter iguaniorum]
MKKVLIALNLVIFLFVASWAGAAYLINKSHKDLADRFKTSEDISVSDAKHFSGLFDVTSSLEFKVNMPIIGALFETSNPMIVRLNLQSDYSPISLLSKNNTTGSLEVLNSPYKDILNELFSTAKPLEFSLESNILKNGSMIFKLSPLNLEDENLAINLSNSSIKVVFEKENIKEIEFALPDAIFSSNDNIIDLSNLKYSIKLPDNTTINDLEKNILYANESYFGLDSIKISTILGKIDINKLSLKATTAIQNAKAVLSSDLDTASLDIFGVKFNDINLKADILNLDKELYEKAMNDISGSDFVSFEQNILKLLKTMPKLEVSNLSFKNDKDNSLKLNYSVSIDEDIKNIDSLDNIEQYVSIAGNLEVKDKVSNLFYWIPNVKTYEDRFIEDGILINKDGKLTASFKLSGDKNDIIFNDNKSLNGFISNF